MKLHIIESPEELIQGFESALATNEGIVIDHVSDNECEQVVANNIIEKFPLASVSSVLQKIVSKIRVGGTLNLSGIDANCFCKAYINDMTTKESLCEAINRCSSMLEVHDIIAALNSLGLEINYYRITGVNYEVSASRK